MDALKVEKNGTYNTIYPSEALIVTLLYTRVWVRKVVPRYVRIDCMVAMVMTVSTSLRNTYTNYSRMFAYTVSYNILFRD